MTNNRLPTLQAFIFLTILVAAPITLYWPGITGEFMLDDVSNLSTLRYQGDGIKTWDDARYFIFEGVPSALGRPISVATFLLNAQDWPAEEEPFKYTNILIHTLSTVILFAALLKLMRLLGRADTDALLIAGLGALVWSIHPAQISTVLYVVQRMTEMAALFVFAALWCYLHGRSRVTTHLISGYGWMSFAIVICGGLAVLSKENGALLPILLLVLEFTLLAHLPRPKHWCWWKNIMLIAPSVFIAGYLIKAIFNYDTQFLNREFTMYERVLTESRILWDYLGNFLFPLNSPTLFHDDFTISKGLFAPFTSAISILLIAISIWLAIRIRRQQPFISFAILWFFAGHLLESTVLSLELYYEHRNYLPYAGFAIAIGYYLSQLILNFKIKGVIAITPVFLILGALTWQHTNDWGDESKLVARWHDEHPKSVRTTIRHTMNLITEDRFDEAVQLTSKMIEYAPEHLTARVFHTTVLCLTDRMTEKDYYILANMAEKSFYTSAAFSRFNHLFELVRDHYCVQISEKGIVNIINKLLQNPYTQYRGPMTTMGYYLMKAEIYSNRKLLGPTIQALNAAYKAYPTVDILMRKAFILTATRHFDEAEQAVFTARELDKSRNKFVPSHEEEFNKAQALIDKGRELLKKGQLKAPQEKNFMGRQ